MKRKNIYNLLFFIFLALLHVVLYKIDFSYQFLILTFVIISFLYCKIFAKIIFLISLFLMPIAVFIDLKKINTEYNIPEVIFLLILAGFFIEVIERYLLKR